MSVIFIYLIYFENIFSHLSSFSLPLYAPQRPSVWEVEELTKLISASLVVQWLRIRLPMQGMWVQSLVQEDSSCHKATKPQ